VELGAGKPVTGAADWAGGEKKVTLKSIFLKPIPVTASNLDVVLKAGYIKKDALCKGVDAAKVAVCK
jgi:D-xylose transport system substrate-binding protein